MLSYNSIQGGSRRYENRSLETICSNYKRALKVEYNIQDLIIFIEAILKNEPERIGLFLALGILYNHIGDDELSKENIEMYLKYVSDPYKAKEALKKRGFVNSIAA
ncbi:hypothetical protein [Butyrivibrio sp. INlla16]|uniref:hypothetical protein n=1 Tax=Butyrivibrio sp. INlla16 TaxID=1520807 RepID=UPI000B8A1DA3|nr:hypothetical protein [Butyrivibrio sp. INlla16]